ncbi:MAG: NAD(P)/FAD-dependent oxidoreductase [Polyangiaceae bacterium]
MAKTPLFASLRRIYQGVAARRTDGTAAPVAASAARPTRRDVLRASASFAALIPAGAAASLVGCGDDTEPPPDAPTEIAIVGGGIAGLHCAYRLRQAGIDSVIYEATDRAGGRMWTGRNLFDTNLNQICEIGGELIDTGHTTLHALADEFDLILDDRTADLPVDFETDTYFVNDVKVPIDTVTQQFVAVASVFQDAVMAADSDETAFATLDSTTLEQWLLDNVPKGTYPELHAVLRNAYRNEFGLETDQQSALNLIYLIGSDDPDPFRIFGISDERYHTHLGNDSFPTKLYEQLDPEAVLFEHRLVAIEDTTGGYSLTFDTPTGQTVRRAARVVFALPFTILREVDTTNLTLSDEKRNIIDELGYGTNAKVMIGFDRRVWKLDYNAAGSIITDLPVQQTWDTTVGQVGNEGILTNFLGGAQGVASGTGTALEWAQNVLNDIELIYPGATIAFTNEVVRQHWPSVDTVKGSYACYKPGQWSFFGLEGKREGNLHFCGEHCSQDWQGYMEGGAETGALVAAEIIDDLGMNQPQGLIKALGPKLVIPQACYRADRWAKLTPFERRRVARAEMQRLLDSAQAQQPPARP